MIFVLGSRLAVLELPVSSRRSPLASAGDFVGALPPVSTGGLYSIRRADNPAQRYVGACHQQGTSNHG